MHKSPFTTKLASNWITNLIEILAAKCYGESWRKKWHASQYFPKDWEIIVRLLLVYYVEDLQCDDCHSACNVMSRTKQPKRHISGRFCGEGFAAFDTQSVNLIHIVNKSSNHLENPRGPGAPVCRLVETRPKDSILLFYPKGCPSHSRHFLGPDYLHRMEFFVGNTLYFGVENDIDLRLQVGSKSTLYSVQFGTKKCQASLPAAVRFAASWWTNAIFRSNLLCPYTQLG